MEYHILPCFSIKSDKIVLFSKLDGYERRYSKVPESNKRCSISLSRKSAQRIKDSINLLYACTKSKTIFEKSSGKYYTFKVNFITLTLPKLQVHTDAEIHKNIFLKFIRHCRRIYKGFMYVYKAEVQDNGNLHYHLNTNTYIHYKTLRDTWNNYCRIFGYIDKSNNNDPNSTDIKAVHNKTALATYMAKYISKKDIYKKPLQRYFRIYKSQIQEHTEYTNLPKNYFNNIKRKVNIKLWDCSNCLKNVRSSHEGIDNQTYNEINTIALTANTIPLDYVTLICDVKYNNPNTPKINKLYKEMVSYVKANDALQASLITIE